MNNTYNVKTLGTSNIKSPLQLSVVQGDGISDFIKDGERVLYNPLLENFNRCVKNKEEPVSFEKAGPKEYIYFEPSETRVAIVTCGGLSPGLNNVIRGLVMTLNMRYNITQVLGIKYGYAGFIRENNHEIINLTPEIVDYIHLHGGSILGSSRGYQPVEKIVDTLENLQANILFTIGGDGTLRGALAIQEEIDKRGLPIAVAGIPKTIDNDINLIEKSFGFETAYSIATEVIKGAHNEAKGAYNGITIVKLMGRDSGFIAAYASLAIQEVNFVLVPEMRFDLDGKKGFFHALKTRLERKNHALIVVAEGAGQYFFEGEEIGYDASGNKIHHDIGLFLKEKISAFLHDEGMRFTLRYIDPSYIIRSAAATASDSIFCNLLAQNAVHGAMAGRKGFIVGYWNAQFTLLPIEVAVEKRKTIDLESDLWGDVIETTGQPAVMIN